MEVDAANAAEATPVAAPTEAQAEGVSAQSAEDIWAKVLELDPEELIRKNPKLQGKLGALAQQQGQQYGREAEQRYLKQIADARAAEVAATERATRRQLAERDPDALAAKVLADEALAEFQENNKRLLDEQRGEMSRALAARLDKFQSKPIFMEAWESATPEQRAKLSWTNYREIDDFFEAAADVIAEHRSEKKAGELAEKRLEAMRKDSVVDGIKTDAANGRADLNLDGMSAGDHIFSEAEIQANITNAAWRKANLSKIHQQAAAGLIRKD